MKMKTADLTGAALDWAVWEAKQFKDGQEKLTFYGKSLWYGEGYKYEWFPSLNWAQGGPIIEQTKMTLDYFGDGSYKDGGMWMATYFIDTPHGTHMNTCEQEGPTALIAAMRCYVANKLGDEIEIPEELTK
jgi:hypothetical protein